MLFISFHCHHSGEKHFCPPSQTFVLRGVTIRNALEMLFIKKVDEKHLVLFASTLTPSIVHESTAVASSVVAGFLAQSTETLGLSI
jgi:hypothetical protein